MKILSIDLRRRIVESYESGKTRTYKETARMFGVGEATVSRLIRKKKETGDLLPGKRGGGPQRMVDMAWLRENAKEYPDKRLIDRVEDWEKKTGFRVSLSTMCDAMHVIGYSYKKNSNSEGT